MDTTCNGWTNHGTWCTNLWLLNNEYTYYIIQCKLRYLTTEELALWLEQHSQTLLQEISCSDTIDFSEVDWLEIARAASE